VNPQKQTVWENDPSDLPEAYRYINTQSATRLTNGNTILCSRGGDGKDAARGNNSGQEGCVGLMGLGKFWPSDRGSNLDEPGIPEKPGESLH